MSKSVENSARRQLAKYVSEEFYAEVRSSVIRQRAVCRTNDKKTNKWFRDLGAMAVEFTASLPADCDDLSQKLAAVGAAAQNASEVRPSSLSKPFTELLDAVQERDEFVSTDLLSSFDKLRELIYRQEKKVSEQADTAVPVQKDTVQEFDRVPKLTDEEFEEIATPIEWGKSLQTAESSQVFEALIDLSSQQVLRYLESKGYGVRQLSDLTGVTRSTLSAIRNGRTVPQESIAKRILKFAISAE